MRVARLSPAFLNHPPAQDFSLSRLRMWPLGSSSASAFMIKHCEPPRPASGAPAPRPSAYSSASAGGPPAAAARLSSQPTHHNDAGDTDDVFLYSVPLPATAAPPPSAAPPAAPSSHPSRSDRPPSCPHPSKRPRSPPGSEAQAGAAAERGAGPKPRSRRKVCDCCRTRKLRCSRSLPCTSCEAHGWACSYAGGAAPLPFLALAGGGGAGTCGESGLQELAASRAELLRLERVVELLKDKWEREQARLLPHAGSDSALEREAPARPASLRLASLSQTVATAPGTPASFETARMLLSLSNPDALASASSSSSSSGPRSPHSRGSTPPTSDATSPATARPSSGPAKLTLPSIATLDSMPPFPERGGSDRGEAILPPIRSVFGGGEARATLV